MGLVDQRTDGLQGLQLFVGLPLLVVIGENYRMVVFLHGFHPPLAARSMPRPFFAKQALAVLFPPGGVIGRLLCFVFEGHWQKRIRIRATRRNNITTVFFTHECTKNAPATFRKRHNSHTINHIHNSKTMTHHQLSDTDHALLGLQL